MEITLQDIDENNFSSVVDLKVAEDQENFVATNVYSIAQSKIYGHLIPKAIYAGEQLVGFSLLGRSPETSQYWLVRLMIGADHQGKGHGRAALEVLFKEMARMPNCNEIFLSVVPSNIGARKLYESSGFEATGETNESGEIVMRYCVPAHQVAT